MALPITPEKVRRIIGKPKVWGPDGDGDDCLCLYRKVDGDVDFAYLWADGDGVSDFNLHGYESCPSEYHGQYFLPNDRVWHYDSLDAIVAAGWCINGYDYAAPAACSLAPSGHHVSDVPCGACEKETK